MYEAEQKQLRAIPQWNFVNLDEMLAKAAAALAANADWSAFWPTALPTSVVVLMDDSTELVKAAVEARLRRMKWHVEQGQRDFAISNQPQYVIDRVLATGCGLTPGMVVNGTNVGIETAFPRGATVRMVLFGFTKTHGYACGLGRDGEWWLVHPESLTESS